tara:strand:+ start:1221 stop:1469 length:249 start_codon:yes stop_codon:yes gene_type:complete
VKYLYLFFFLVVLAYLILFFNLNSSFIELDLYFYKFNGITLGFSLIAVFFSGMILSYLLQIPILLRKPKKTKPKKNDNKVKT